MLLEHVDDLYQRHFSEIHRLCYRMVRNKEEAEDLAHEAFVNAYYHFDPDQQASFRTYIFKIARNLCLDHYKSKRYQANKRTDFVDTDLFIDESLKTNGKLLHQEIIAVLHHCLDKLTEEEKLSVRLHFIEQFAYREIADIIEKSTSTVKNRVESGLMHLRDCLRKNEIIGS